MLIILFCNMFVLLSIVLVLYFNANTYEKIPTGQFVFFATTLLAMCIFAASFGYNLGFKGGQVKALTGNIKYELVVQPDSTRIWEEIK
jgi:hypothetical protein